MTGIAEKRASMTVRLACRLARRRTECRCEYSKDRARFVRLLRWSRSLLALRRAGRAGIGGGESYLRFNRKAMEHEARFGDEVNGLDMSIKLKNIERRIDWADAELERVWPCPACSSKG